MSCEVVVPVLQDLVNLHKLLRQPLSPALVLYLTVELLRIAQHLQRVHVIHGDVKPDNVIVRDE